MNQDLLRQRRNLIATSAVLLVFDFAQVTITKVSVLGTELLVGNAKILMICAWVLWAYFLLRYYQYWRAEPDQHIRSSFKKRLDAYARSYTKATAFQDAAGQGYDNYKITRTGLASWSYTIQVYDPVKGNMKDGPVFALPAWRLAAWSLKSALFVGIQTPHATDHILPFALAIAAPVITLCTRL
ncbi:MAG TPA: hypothetical protein VMV99_03045 [Rhodanobacter sp.]|nr:hypothetical protein [Rhodanobacter sp.]